MKVERLSADAASNPLLSLFLPPLTSSHDLTHPSQSPHNPPPHVLPPLGTPKSEKMHGKNVKSQLWGRNNATMTLQTLCY